MNWKKLLRFLGKAIARGGWYLIIKFGDKNKDGKLDNEEAVQLVNEFKAFIKKFK